ncbi:hypothetical protein [Sphingomonas morindae]|uniref:Transposase n=1 Tax=Sphingomonas morindae TaxID=1541170 RepID=A0ABY4X3Y5_9SPHN|nr:hypothetical protein [Sphingomonas morindae]USI71594.1 hypothetical protein LHA26_09620 [Sphingomonas morindae]
MPDRLGQADREVHNQRSRLYLALVAFCTAELEAGLPRALHQLQRIWLRLVGERLLHYFNVLSRPIVSFAGV